jgi:hypothetical protein
MCSVAVNNIFPLCICNNGQKLENINNNKFNDKNKRCIPKLYESEDCTTINIDIPLEDDSYTSKLLSYFEVTKKTDNLLLNQFYYDADQIIFVKNVETFAKNKSRKNNNCFCNKQYCPDFQFAYKKYFTYITICFKIYKFPEKLCIKCSNECSNECFDKRVKNIYEEASDIGLYPIQFLEFMKTLKLHNN